MNKIAQRKSIKIYIHRSFSSHTICTKANPLAIEQFNESGLLGMSTTEIRNIFSNPTNPNNYNLQLSLSKKLVGIEIKGQIKMRMASRMNFPDQISKDKRFIIKEAHLGLYSDDIVKEEHNGKELSTCFLTQIGEVNRKQFQTQIGVVELEFHSNKIIHQNFHNS